MQDLRATNPGDLQDIGSYLQSLLQIMAADGHLHEHEQERIRAYAERIGFESGYIEEAIGNVLKNKYMPKTPPKFNSVLTAQDFLIAATELAICDGHIHPREKEWLLASAKVNGLDPEMVLAKIRDYL